MGGAEVEWAGSTWREVWLLDLKVLPGILSSFRSRGKWNPFASLARGVTLEEALSIGSLSFPI